MKVLSDVEKHVLVEMWKDGVTREELGSHFGISPQTVWGIVNRMNKGKSSQREVAKKPERSELYERYVTDDFSAKDLSEHYGVNLCVVKGWLRKDEIKKGRKKGGVDYREVDKPSSDDLYTYYILEDYTQAELAKKYGISISKMQRWLAEEELFKVIKKVIKGEDE